MPPRKPAAARPITMQPDTPNITFGELCAEVVRFKRLRNLAPDTIDYYADCGNYLAEFLGEDTLCQSITEDTYYNYIEYLHQTKPHLKSATERSYLTGIRAILYYGMKKGYIQQFAVQLPKMDEVVKDTYTDAELALLLKKPNIKKCSFAEYRNWVLINFMLGTGNRVGTIVNIKLEDVDLALRVANSGLEIYKALLRVGPEVQGCNFPLVGHDLFCYGTCRVRLFLFPPKHLSCPPVVFMIG